MTTTLNHTKIQQICAFVEQGAFPETAAAYVGVTEGTFRRWLRRGRKEMDRRDKYAEEVDDRMSDVVGNEIRAQDHQELCRKEQIFYDLVLAIDMAVAKSEIADISVITRAAQGGDWQAAKFKLERGRSQRWGKKTQVQHGGRDGGPVEVELSFADIIKQAMGGETAGESTEKQVEGKVSDVKRLEAAGDRGVPRDSRGIREGSGSAREAIITVRDEGPGRDDPER